MPCPRYYSLLPLLGLGGFVLPFRSVAAFRTPIPVRNLCPETCKVAGYQPSNWTVLGEFGQLQACDNPLLVDFSIYIPVTDKQQIRTCKVEGDDFYTRDDSNPFVSASLSSLKSEEVVPHLAWTPAASQNDIGGKVATQSVEHLERYLRTGPGAENRTIMFATVSGSTVGVYVGADLVNPSVSEKLFPAFVESLLSVGIADSKASVLQVCDGRSSNQIFGLIAAASADFHTVHEAVGTWSNGSCVDTSSYEEVLKLSPTAIAVVRPKAASTTVNSNTTYGLARLITNSTGRAVLKARADCRTIDVKPGNGCGNLVDRCGGGLTVQDFYRFNPNPNLCSTLQPGQLVCCSSGTLPVPPEPKPNADGTCKTERVDEGDDCGKLVTLCGITPNQFTQYNTLLNLCATLQPGQRVCCTPGSLPDIRPKNKADGSCFPYKIKPDDFCAKVAMTSGLTVNELESMNKDTWGWNGCANGFWPDNWICLSEGTPPFPAPIANAVCGPQKPGTIMPKGSSSRDWAKLNPCPLNSCCNVWGQCGTTADFCIDTNTGPPGTARKDTYGCISNCGMGLIRSGPPAQFIKLGYFEAWNLGRSCLNMDVSQIDPSYTHVHFAFGMIDDNFEIYFEDRLSQTQFERFKELKGPKRIISFGGWVFSAELGNYHIFRNGVNPENRERLADNLVNFVIANSLDGLDIDWEYPSAPNLGEGVPQGEPDEALNYLRLLASIRRKMPKDRSLSIAAPASYWYLKQFPIAAMSELLDYIVYMTYDLHGQWDAGNKWATPGCPTGNCLRSHVNRTLTMDSLVMITKAGVPSNKVLVGVSSYGRSFQMADPSCTGPNCRYTGDRSTSFARKGECTDTAGYISNAEINAIGGNTWLDVESNSNIMVSGDLWVGYMDDALKAARTRTYQAYNFGGTIDWAVDLQQFHNPPGEPGTTWGNFKVRALMSLEVEGCKRTERTGDWINKSCTERVVRKESEYTPEERWSGLDCKAAWHDARLTWETCATDEQRENGLFARKIAEVFHMPGGYRCRDRAENTDCEAITTCVQRHDVEGDYSGACGFWVWNSITAVHNMIRNYWRSLDIAGADLLRDKDAFIKTFAPTREGGEELLELVFGLLQIPLGIAGSRFFGSSLMSKAFFSGPAGDTKKELLEEAVGGIAGIGMDEAKNQIKNLGKMDSVDFTILYNDTITNWKNQMDTLLRKIFDGSPKSVQAIENLISDGKMLPGINGGGWKTSEHTDAWNQEKAIQRAFYALTIPRAWDLNGYSPVLVRFTGGKKNGCDIDASRYFFVHWDVYNVAWRCFEGESWILAGVRHSENSMCGPGTPGMPCTPQVRWTLDVLDGIEEIRDGKWGGITIDDLIHGAYNTWRANDQTNKLGDPSTFATPKSGPETLADPRLDITVPGFIRIPVCSAEEVKKNLALGRKRANTPNYPCN
ncbi:hypothetical protein PspLS_05914 [Pyricularia sp. CBS 133598]|nr:hypothetical protein PspLS_05914 [Pyricularia sp. CBS 133598]